MKTALVALLAIASLSAGQGPQTFAGTITDDMCARADHSGMRMGPTDPECTTACVTSHGASFVLYDGTTAYELSSGKPLEPFAGKKVTVTGVLDAKTHTLRVETITAA